MKATLAALIICLISCGPAYQGTVDNEILTRQTAAVNITLAEAVLALHNRLTVLEQQITTLDGGIRTILEWIQIHEQLKAQPEAAP